MPLIPAPSAQDPCPMPPEFASSGTTTPWTLAEWEVGFTCGIADPTKFNWIFQSLINIIKCQDERIKKLEPENGGVKP